MSFLTGFCGLKNSFNYFNPESQLKEFFNPEKPVKKLIFANFSLEWTLADSHTFVIQKVRSGRTHAS